MCCLQFLRKCRQPEAKSACSGWTWPTFIRACNQCFLLLEEDKLDINSCIHIVEHHSAFSYSVYTVQCRTPAAAV